MIGSVPAVRHFTVGGRLGKVKTLVARNSQICYFRFVAHCAQQAGDGEDWLLLLLHNDGGDKQNNRF